MWIKINGLPIQVSSIKNISKIEQISEDMIIKYYNKSSRNRFYSSDDISESSKIQYVNKYITSNNKSTGNVINYLKKEDGSDDYDHIIKSTFKLNCDIFIFYICAEEISYSEGKCNLFNNNIYSKIFDTIEEAQVVHNNLLTKLNEIEMSLVNIEI